MRCQTLTRAVLITMLMVVPSMATLPESEVSAATSSPPAPAATPEANTVEDATSTIDAMLTILNDTYVFPEIATKMEEAILAHQNAGATTASPTMRRWPQC